MAVVATSLEDGSQAGKIDVPGYKLADIRTIGGASVKGNKVKLGLNDVAVMIFEKK